MNWVYQLLLARLLCSNCLVQVWSSYSKYVHTCFLFDVWICNINTATVPFLNFIEDSHFHSRSYLALTRIPSNTKIRVLQKQTHQPLHQPEHKRKIYDPHYYK